MTTFSQDIKSNIILYCFTSSCFWSSMTRSDSISSAPVLCGCAQADSCADSLWYWPAHWQPRRAYGQRTSLKYIPTPATMDYHRVAETLQRGNANIGDRVGPWRKIRWRSLARHSHSNQRYDDDRLSIQNSPYTDCTGLPNRSLRHC